MLRELLESMMGAAKQKSASSNRVIQPPVGGLNPTREDGYDSTIKYLNGTMQRGRTPVDMEQVPTNFTRNRTGYFQGSNPFYVGTQRPQSGFRVQTSELDRYLNR